MGLSLFMFGVLFFAYLIMATERGLCNTEVQNNVLPEDMQQFESLCDARTTLANFLNSAWLISCTMTTVGYGDVFPYTLLGRTFAFLAALYGLSLTAVAVHC